MFLKCLILVFTLSFIDAQFSYYRSSSQPCTLPRIPHGRARVRQRGNFIKFSCLGRYTLVGNKYATCRNGQWDVPVPVCIKSGCSQLEEVKNAVNMTHYDNAWVVFFCLPGYNLVGSPVVYCDGKEWNSTAPGCFDGSVKHSTECDFEKSDICGWRADEMHDFDWRRWNKKTPSYFLQTGPEYDHTYGENGTGFYMYIESTGRVANESARLISPVYDAEIARNGCFIFYYHMFGRSMGGLRVYQKPDKVPMYQMLSGPQRDNYTLFQEWGNQGNEWYSSVSMLSNFSDDFQIVIEGIRGKSFMSDIAIDDVSIQHGENCSKAMAEATTPPNDLIESCVGRCDMFDAQDTVYRGCSCSLVCVVTDNCCPDFLDVCEFPVGYNSTDDDDYSTPASNNSVALPQTQKLVATTTETLPSTTSTSTTTSTARPTTSKTRSSISTSTSTTTTTTKRPTTKYIRPTTTLRITTSTKLPTTVRTSTTSRATTKMPPTPTPTPTTTVSKPIIKSKSTTLTFEVTPISSTTLFIVQTTKNEDRDNTGKALNDKFVGNKTGGMSGATIAVTVLLVAAACCGALWAAVVMTRSNRGVAALARLRGRTSSDPEVRYLNKSDDVDDE